VFNKIYKFDVKTKQLLHEVMGDYFDVVDYFQYYTTGVENLINEENMLLIETDRYEKERHDLLAWTFYRNENFTDVLLAINNENIFWNDVMDFDTLDIIKKNKLKYIQKIKNKTFTPEEQEYWDKKISNTLENNNDNQRKIIIVSDGDKNTMVRKIKDYFKEREVN